MLREPRVVRLTDVTKAEVERLGRINTLFKMFDVPAYAQYQPNLNGQRGPKPFSIRFERQWFAPGLGPTNRWTVKRYRTLSHLQAAAARMMHPSS